MEDESQKTPGAAHYIARGKGKEREPTKQTISRQVVEETIEVANHLLHDVIALRQTVVDGHYPDGLHSPLGVWLRLPPNDLSD